MNDLSETLNANKSIICCCLNGVLYNHLIYAVDTCICEPSLYAIFVNCLHYVFDNSKSKHIMCFRLKVALLLNVALITPYMY